MIRALIQGSAAEHPLGVGGVTLVGINRDTLTKLLAETIAEAQRLLHGMASVAVKHAPFDREEIMSRLLLICVLVGVGCKGSTAPLLPSPVGNYVLTTVDSKPLPAQQTAGDSILTGGAVIYSNGAYAINWLAPSYYFGTRSEVAARDTGVWAGSAGQLSFTSTSGASWTANFTAPSLTVHLAQDTWTFVKP